RRYLLPVDLLRFDEGAGVLRAQTEKEVAERYPAFDRAAVETMSEADRGRYEARVLTFFPREQGRTPSPERDVATLPEWLLNGAWITVPPQDAHRTHAAKRAVRNAVA